MILKGGSFLTAIALVSTLVHCATKEANTPLKTTLSSPTPTTTAHPLETETPIKETIIIDSTNLPQGYIRGIDVSELNGTIDWDLLGKKYKKGDLSYIILRMAENYSNGKRQFTPDSEFEKNLSECNKRGIPYGVYVFSRGSTEEEINTETESIINYIKNNLNKEIIVNGETLNLTFNLSLPLYMDCFEEDAVSQYAIFEEGTEESYDRCAELIKLWCDNIATAGYFVGVYCNDNFYTEMGINRLSEYSLWIAHYGYKAINEEVSKIQLNNMVNFNSIIKNQQIKKKDIQTE